MEPVPTSQGEIVMRKVGACAYVECSARLQYNIKNVFETAVSVVLHPPPWLGPGLLGCVFRGDVGGVKSALKNKQDLECVDFDVLLVFVGILH
jgi:hypothetical protein